LYQRFLYVQQTLNWKRKNYYQQLNMAIENTLKRFRATDRSQIYHRIQMAEHIYAYGTGWAQRNAVLELKRNFLSCDRRIIDLTAKKSLNSHVNILQNGTY
ncbi:hypothetical protein, partial [Sporolactobacillus inulinus]